MNFNDLYKKIADLDKPLAESVVSECGDMTPSVPPTPAVPPVSMSVNINAQGIDNIKDMMKLWTAVNPDMMPKTDLPAPTMTDPSQMIGKMEPIGGRMELPPLKPLALPTIADKEKKIIDDEKEIEDYANEPEVSKKDIGYMTKDISGGLGKQQGTYPKVADGDNPMQKVKEDDSLEQIRLSLQQQLESFKNQ